MKIDFVLTAGNINAHYTKLYPLISKIWKKRFNLDKYNADEIPDTYLIKALPFIIEENMKVDVYLTPRINTVEGLQENHIKKWGWNVNEDGWVNWPDYQWRIWKNKPEIKWRNKVHEILEGYNTFANLPALPELALYHPKTIERQIKQNAYYDTL